MLHLLGLDVLSHSYCSFRTTLLGKGIVFKRQVMARKHSLTPWPYSHTQQKITQKKTPKKHIAKVHFSELWLHTAQLSLRLSAPICLWDDSPQSCWHQAGTARTPRADPPGSWRGEQPARTPPAPSAPACSSLLPPWHCAAPSATGKRRVRRTHKLFKWQI